MASLQTTYMGIQLKNPVIAGACSHTTNLDRIKEIDKNGAAALVISSLFEEEIELERLRLEQEMESVKYRHPEMIDIFPDLEHAGPKEHLFWVEKAKKSVSIPVIASLNCINRDTWVDYAKQLEETGVDGLELNFFATPSDFDRTGPDIENEQLDSMKAVKKAVKIPISVKLSVYYSNPLNFVKRVDEAGVDGIVLFNRFFQPDIQIEDEKNIFPFNFSGDRDYRLPLRYAGLTFGNIGADVCSSTGIMNAKDVARMILAGARVIQCVSAMYRHKIPVLGSMVSGLEEWMDKKGYETLDDFRGKMSRENNKDPWVYTRAQYVRLLLKPEKFIGV